jgi:haloalkane dehalogenase
MRSDAASRTGTRVFPDRFHHLQTRKYMTDISPRMPYEKKFVEVLGQNMAYVEHGSGDPVVFLHGNATSSYMWRNIMPHLEGRGRLIALDNIGQGDSARLPDSGPDSYTLAEHQTYIDGALEALGVAAADNVTFVMHDWGGPLGMSWAHRHADRIKALAYSEVLVCNHESYSDYPDAVGNMLKRLRTDEGEELVLENNFFVENVFVAGVIREIDEATMDEVRRPFREPGENRRATLTWPRQIPIEGEPADVAGLMDVLSGWMQTNEIPKLFINVEPGQIVFEKDLEILRSWSHSTAVTVRGKHHPQEDSPHEIGKALADWYAGL